MLWSGDYEAEESPVRKRSRKSVMAVEIESGILSPGSTTGRRRGRPLQVPLAFPRLEAHVNGQIRHENGLD